MCMCAYTSPIVLLMETQPNPAFDEPFVSWTYMYLKGRRAIVILCSYYTDGHTIAHRSRFVCFWGENEKKRQKKEEKEVLATGMHTVLSTVMLFFSSPLTFITPIKTSLSLTASLSS